MDEKIFERLSEEELIKGCNSCAINANAHYESALRVAEIEHYGIASSLLILSVEEAIKGLIFMSKLMGMDTPDKVERFFSKHESRHQAARDLYEFIKNIMDSVDEVKDCIKENGRLLMIQHAVKGMPDDIEAWKIDFLSNLTKNTQDEISRIIMSKSNDRDQQQERADKKWWNKANQLKNSGFYVDYKGEWLLPQNITKEDFDVSQTKVYNVLSLLQKICSIDIVDYNFMKQILSTTQVK